MKKVLLVILILLMTFMVIGCGKDVDSEEGERVTSESEVDILSSAFYVLDDPDNISKLDDIELLEITEKNVSVSRIYEGSSNSGYAIMVKSKGYEDEYIDVMVGIKSGKVTYVTVVGMDYTLEDNKLVLNIIDQYPGKTKLDDVTDIKKNKSNIDSVSGATITSNSIYQAVYIALEEYKLLSE